jgi:hypothetical protein
MRRRVEVGADMQRHGDLLPAGLVERQSLDPPNRWARIAGKRGGVQREILGEVDELHDAARVMRKQCTCAPAPAS